MHIRGAYAAADVHARMERVPRREQIGFAVFSTWTVIGLFLDGWAHRHDKPETFFSPYHGILYSGVAAGVLWSLYESRRIGTPIFSGSRLTSLGLALTPRPC